MFMRKHKQRTGIPAMQREGYKLSISNEKALQRLELPWWGNQAFIIFLTISMSLLDALFLYDILDRVSTQSAWSGKITSLAVAMILNTIPLVVAHFVHQAQYKLKRGAAVKAVLATIVFFMFFAATVYLRFTYKDIYSDTGSGLINEMQVEDMQEEATTEENPQADEKSLAAVIFYSIEPLATSVLNLLLAYQCDDPMRARRNQLRIRRLELTEEEADLKAYLATIESAEFRRNQQLLLDRERKTAAQKEIHARCQVLKALARGYLAEYLRDPEAISYVTSSMGTNENRKIVPESEERIKEMKMEKKAA